MNYKRKQKVTYDFEMVSRPGCVAKNIKLARISVDSEHEKGSAPYAITLRGMAKCRFWGVQCSTIENNLIKRQITLKLLARFLQQFTEHEDYLLNNDHIEIQLSS